MRSRVSGPHERLSLVAGQGPGRSLAGNPAFRWEYQRELRSVRTHYLTVTTKSGEKLYTLTCRAPESQWPQWKPLCEQIVASFTPQP